MSGDRSFCYIETLYIKDERNGLFCEVVFNIEKKSKISSFFSSKKADAEERADYFEGVISMKDKIDYKKNRNKL